MPGESSHINANNVTAPSKKKATCSPSVAIKEVKDESIAAQRLSPPPPANPHHILQHVSDLKEDNDIQPRPSTSRSPARKCAYVDSDAEEGLTSPTLPPQKKGKLVNGSSSKPIDVDEDTTPKERLTSQEALGMQLRLSV